MPSEKNLKLKQDQVAELKDKISSAAAGVLVDYRGINVEDDTKLRRELRQAGVEYSVIKNNILRRAMTDAGMEDLTAYAVGTTAFAYSVEDPMAPAKILNKYAEASKGKFSIKAGFMDGEILDAAGVQTIAKLPGRTELLTMLCVGLNGTIRGLAAALNAIAEKGEEVPA